MIILVLNSGSSSIKYKLFDISKNSEKLLDKGVLERIGEKISSHKEALAIILKKMNRDIEAVGHRVVHGGDVFKESTLIDEGAIKSIERFSELAPLHNPPSLLTINESRNILSGIPHAAVFDTSFYQDMPERAYLYAIPYKFFEKYRIRKYGFHGTSHRYVATKAASILKRPLEKLSLITCHLGNGCSITAVENGRAIDTSMGFTPLEGLVMGTRSGDVDAAILPYIMEKENLDINAVIDLLNKKSGLLGISGISNDMREIIKEMGKNKKAALAFDLFSYRIKKYIGAYAGVMGGCDAVVFTGGIGENQPLLMKDICKGVVAKSAKVLIIPTDEELMIARDTFELVKYANLRR
ncbi:MAG: acetate kinase [Candidatus Omnitrophica bacterium]|nr:acetate kinase [Candidatus Omnitrophota bacterium]